MKRILWAIVLLVAFIGGNQAQTAEALKPRFADQIAAYEQNDKLHPPPKGGILFIGSSIFRLWKNLPQQMAPLPVFNRAFGGSRTDEVLHYVDRVVLPYEPRIIVYYCGSNDINVNAEAEHIATRFKQFSERVIQKLPRTRIFFVSINRAPQKVDKWKVVDATNRLIRDYCLAVKNLGYIDVNKVLFDKNRQPRMELFLADRLHFVDKAYEEFTPIIKPVIAKAWHEIGNQHLTDKDFAASQVKLPEARNQYLFAYFKNNGEDGLHLAHSTDGLNWRALNDDKPYLTPLVGSQKLMRDPCILLGPDNVFHLVWTTGWRGRDIGIAHSTDLIHWSEQQAIPVMEHEPTAVNAWAPEIIYDEAQQQYMIYWSTTIPGRFPATETSGNNGLNHRIYFTTTKDFKTYTKAEVLYDDGFNVIDANIVKDGNRYVMVLKDETQNPEPKKHLRIAAAERVTGPYSKAAAPFTADWVEGPTSLKVNGAWLVYYDHYRDHKYGVSQTRDWQKWEVLSDKLRFPAGMRHGTAFAVTEALAKPLLLNWNQAQRQPAEFYGSDEARRIADNLLLYQRDTGGWPKNTNMAIVISDQTKAELTKLKPETDSTIDNGATYSQLRYLARVFTATKEPRYQESFLRGLDYLFKAQYANGGWPQFYPDLSDYYKHITYNDGAMVGVLELLRDIVKQKPEVAFVDAARCAKAAAAVAKGTECILKTQIIVAGQKTAWCAQHDEITLAPAKARKYEHPSISGSESAGIVRFLMGIERPDARVRDAIESAVAWFKQTQINGYRYYDKRDPALENGYDRVIEPAANASPLWARFYEIGTNRPIFSGRDSVIKYSVTEIEHERRTGYGWYSDAPLSVINKDYPAWQRRIAAKK